MIAAAFPGFLFAGAALAAVPVVLHFLTRRPPDRVALPTARFLSPDPRTLLRLRPRPSDLALMTVRVAFMLALGAAFAGLFWAPERSGEGHFVLVDGGADAAVRWDEVAAVTEAEASSDPDAPAGPVTIVVYGLDGGWRTVDADGLADLERGTRPATVEDGLTAVRAAARRSTAARATVTWVGRPSWQVWSPGFGLMRSSLWPGRIEMRATATDRGTTAADEDTGAADIDRVSSGSGTTGAGSETASLDGEPARRAPVAWIPAASTEDPLVRAVEALGAEVVTDLTFGDGAAPDWLFPPRDDVRGVRDLLDVTRAGATMVASGRVAAAEVIPWTAPVDLDDPADEHGASLVTLPGDRPVGSPVPRLGGRPSEAARVVAVFDDATPAATADTLGRGCVAYLAADLEASELTRAAEYPLLVRALVDGCVGAWGTAGASDIARGGGGAYPDASLDQGGLLAIARPDLPASVDLATLLATEGRSLTRWFLLLALMLLGLELAMTRERRA